MSTVNTTDARNNMVSAASVSTASANVKVECTSVHADVKNDAYSKYNFFTEQYNNSANIVDKIKLQSVPVPKLLCTFKYGCLICIFLLAFCPFVAFLTLSLSFYFLIVLIMITVKVHENREKVPDPFKRMIYCESTKFVNEYFKISASINYQELSAIGVSAEAFNLVTTQFSNITVNGGSVDIMFYSQTFRKYETNVLNCMPLKIIYFVLLFSASVFGAVISISIL